jgi:hypothetical protein
MNQFNYATLMMNDSGTPLTGGVVALGKAQNKSKQIQFRLSNVY